MPLLQRGMGLNTSDTDGNTLLMLAALSGKAQLVDSLLKNNANYRKAARTFFAGHRVVRNVGRQSAVLGGQSRVPDVSDHPFHTAATQQD